MLNNLSFKQLTLLIASILLVAGISVSSGITYLTSEISDIKRVWQEYQAERGDKARILVRLQAVLGYGGMIHDFKNLILRKDLAQLEVIHTKLGAADDLLGNLRSLSLDSHEIDAAKAIESVLREYEEALHRAEAAIKQGRTASYIDRQVKVDDRPAFKGLAVLREINLSRRHEYVSGIGKWILASDLRASLGYGGMIHSYKNYLLRHQDEYFYRAMDKITAVYQQVSSYQALGVSSEESAALKQLLLTIQTYQASLEQARLLVQQGMKIESIDRQIRIEDVPAINALNILSREIFQQLEAKSENVLESLNAYQDLGILLVIFTLLAIIILVSLLVWVVVRGISRPIARMSTQMYTLADGNTEIEINNKSQQNEIGAMARAVETFRLNAIKQLASEHALSDANLELEKHLVELRKMKEKSDQQVEETSALADNLADARDDAFNASRIAEEQKERANAIINSVSDAIISIDDSSRIITFNRAAEEIFGYPVAEVQGKDLSILMPNPHKSSHHQYMDNYHKSRKSKMIGDFDEFGQRRELPALRKNGDIFPMDISVGETQVSGRRMYIGVVRDLSKLKVIEKMKREFVSTVSHELRTPLTSLKGALGLIFSGTLEKDEKKSAEMKDLTLRNVERLNNLVNDILDMEKIETGEMSFDIETTDVNEIAEEAIALNQHYAIQHGINFELKNRIADCYVNVDRDRIAQVMANLLSNAAKFSPENSVVSIDVSRQADKIRFSVSDHGPGIDEAFQPLIFERFTQQHSGNTRETGGTGLGMPISKAIIEKHGGKIGFTTKVGKGSNFFFELDEVKY